MARIIEGHEWIPESWILLVLSIVVGVSFVLIIWLCGCCKNDQTHQPTPPPAASSTLTPKSSSLGKSLEPKKPDVDTSKNDNKPQDAQLPTPPSPAATSSLTPLKSGTSGKPTGPKKPSVGPTGGEKLALVASNVTKKKVVDFKPFAASLAEFSLTLYRHIDKDNIFLSPLSISFALAMMYAGASGNTKQQMGKVLFGDQAKKSDEEFHSAYAAAMELVNKAGGSYKLHMANQVYVHEPSLGDLLEPFVKMGRYVGSK